MARLHCVLCMIHHPRSLPQRQFHKAAAQILRVHTPLQKIFAEILFEEAPHEALQGGFGIEITPS
jgi:hypothetical protein